MYNFHCFTGKPITSTLASPTIPNNLVPTESSYDSESIPDPCTATLDTIMLGKPESTAVVAAHKINSRSYYNSICGLWLGSKSLVCQAI